MSQHKGTGFAKMDEDWTPGPALSPRPLPEGRGSYPCRLKPRFPLVPIQSPLPSERGA